MKKLIASALVASMLITTPAFAEHRKRDRDYSQHKRHKSDSGCGGVCGAIIGGVVVGALSSERKERKEQDQEYDNRYYPPDHRVDKRYLAIVSRLKID